MLNFKKEIAKKIAETIEIDIIEIEKSIEVPKEKNMGDYAFPCFRLAKTLKKAPQAIAEEIKEKLDLNRKFSRKSRSIKSDILISI